MTTVAEPGPARAAAGEDRELTAATVDTIAPSIRRRALVPLLAVATFFLPVAISPLVQAPAWTPKVAIALTLLGPGLVALLVHMRRGERVAWWGAAYLVWSLIAATLAASPVLAIVGPYQLGNGWLFGCLLVGMWALGRELSSAEVRTIATALRWAIVANAVVAWLAMWVVLPAPLGTLDGRSYGLVGNPVQLGGFMAAAVVLLADRSTTRRWWLLGVALAAGAVQLSGSRQGLLLLVAALVYLAWRHRRAVWPVALACVAGIVLATPLAGASGTSRLGPTEQAGDAERLDTWRVGLLSAIDHPLFGSGPGLFEDATTPYRRANWSGCAPARFIDAHNTVVQQATTVGVVGLGLFAVFVAAALRRARSALGVFGALLGATTLLQPSFVGLTPVAFLALGASAAAACSRPWGRQARVAAAAGAAVGLVAGVTFVRADMYYKVANELDSGAAVALLHADRLMPPWWEIARQGTLTTITDDVPASLAWAREAVRRDPQSAVAMVQLGKMERRFGSKDAAWSDLVRALQLDPSARDTAVELRDLADETTRVVPEDAVRLLAATASCPPAWFTTTGS